MSSQLMDPETDAGLARPDAPASPRATPSVMFDRATRGRLIVAEDVAVTLESLAEARAWDRVDPAIRQHLLAHARRLEEHVAHLGSQRAVRAVEETALRLKRLERRLDIVVDELDPPEDARHGAAGLFLGDFTEVQPDDDAPASRGEKKAEKKGDKRKKGAAGQASERIAEGMRRFRTRAEKAAARATSRRFMAYFITAVVTCGGAVAWNAKESFTEARQIKRAPATHVRVNDYTKELAVFLPVITTTMRDKDMRVTVARDWLLRSESQRNTDAAGAHVWLSNRNITKLLITWEDGTPLAFFGPGQVKWYDMAAPGKVVSSEGEAPAP